MKKIIFLIFIFTLLTLSTPYSQITGVLPEKESLMPIPSWIKEGVSVVYSVEAGSRVGIGAESSSAYLTGYIIYLVTTIQNNRVYGMIFNILSNHNRGEINFDLNLKLLNTPGAGLYLHPKTVEGVLKDRDLYAQQGIVVEGGLVGSDLYYFSVTTPTVDEITITSEQFTSEGIIKKSTITRKSTRGGEAGNKNLVGIYNINLPLDLKLPDIARRDVSYAVYGIGMGITNYWGNTNYRFLSSEGNIANYQIVSTDYISGNTQGVGDRFFGPFYINPALLRRKPIISIPQIGFSLDSVGYGQNRGVLLVLSLSNQPIAQWEVDPNTGLFLNVTYPKTGFIVHAQIQR